MAEAPAIRSIHDRFLRAYPGEVARALEESPADEVADYLNGLPREETADLLARMRPDTAAATIERLGAQAAPALARLDPAGAAALLARVNQEQRDALLGRLEPAIAQELRALLEYPLDSAGQLMDPSVATFRPHETVSEAQDRVRRLPQRRRIQDLFLIDEHGHLIGAVAIQDVALADPEDRLESLARSDPARVQATAGREEILEVIEARRPNSLAVVGFDGQLLGVIRPRGLVEAAQEEATASLQTMVGASRDERALSSPAFAVRKRQPWLQVNLGTAFLAAAVVGLFEETIATYTALAVLLPVVAGQSGNTGSQALAVTMRGLALREVRPRHWWRVAAKEVVAAAVNGLAVALTTGAAVYLWSGSLGLTGVIFISMILSMTIAGLAGALIPMILTSLGQDPAQSSSIILTTVTDVAGFFSFLGIATMLSFAL